MLSYCRCWEKFPGCLEAWSVVIAIPIPTRSFKVLLPRGGRRSWMEKMDCAEECSICNHRRYAPTVLGALLQKAFRFALRIHINSYSSRVRPRMGSLRVRLQKWQRSHSNGIPIRWSSFLPFRNLPAARGSSSIPSSSSTSS